LPYFPRYLASNRFYRILLYIRKKLYYTDHQIGNCNRAFSSRWKDVEIAVVVIYHYYSLKISKAEKMETQKDFENKVTEFIHRLPPIPGNGEDLLTAANIQNQDDETLAVFHAAG